MIGYDSNWGRDVGYGVPATCDHPDCTETIDRGLPYVCGGQPHGGDEGCGLHFCGKHMYNTGPDGEQQCERCGEGIKPFEPKPDVQEWINWKLTDNSWEQWRQENPADVLILRGRTNEN